MTLAVRAGRLAGTAYLAGCALYAAIAARRRRRIPGPRRPQPSGVSRHDSTGILTAVDIGGGRLTGDEISYLHWLDQMWHDDPQEAGDG